MISEVWIARHRRPVAGVAVALALSVLAVWLVVNTRGSFPGDATVRGWTGGIGHRPLWDVFQVLGSPVAAALAAVALTASAWLRDGWRFAVLVAGTVPVVGAATALKHLFGPSSLQVHSNRWWHAGTLPSGHAAYAAAVLGMGAVLALRARRRLLAGSLVAITLAVGPVLLARRVHWLSDVLAGYALGLAWLAALLAVGLPWAARTRLEVPN